MNDGSRQELQAYYKSDCLDADGIIAGRHHADLSQHQSVGDLVAYRYLDRPFGRRMRLEVT